jgi:hypothetical protein
MSKSRAGIAVRPFIPVKAQPEWVIRRSKRLNQAQCSGLGIDPQQNDAPAQGAATGHYNTCSVRLERNPMGPGIHAEKELCTLPPNRNSQDRESSLYPANLSESRGIS